MAFQPGHGSYLLLDTNDWSSYMDSESLDQVRDTLETTAFGDGARTYIAGLQSGSISLSGPWDSVLDGYVIATNDGAVVAYEFGPEGSSGVKKSGNALFTDYSVSTSVDGRVEWSASFQPTGAITTGTF
jgi:hypothetical protein